MDVVKWTPSFLGLRDEDDEEWSQFREEPEGSDGQSADITSPV